MTSALLQRLRVDLDQGFVDVVDAYGPMVLSIATRLRDRSAAEDICQETFLRAYRALQSRNGNYLGLQLRPWLATITVNLVRNEARRRSRKATVSGCDQTLLEVGTGPLRPVEDAVIDRNNYQQLERAVASLPRDQREAVVLRHIAGLSTRETATVMGCPIGTAKSHLARGLAALRAVIDESEKDE